MRLASTPTLAALALTHSRAPNASSIAAGHLFSGAQAKPRGLPRKPPSCASASSVNGDLEVGIQAVFDDVVEKYAHRQPETGAIDRAFRLERDDGAPRIVHGLRAMLFCKVGGDAVQVVGT